METLLEVEGLAKSFYGVPVLSDIGWQVTRGEIHALVGENGAGKSTLCKIICGIYKKDAGIIRINGRETEIANPRDGHRAGISMVQQEPQLVPTLTIAENLAMHQGKLPIHVDRRRLNGSAEETLAELGAKIRPQTLASDLSVPQRQIVEIAKALVLNSQLIILDEPTAALSYREEQRLFEVTRTLQRRGVTIIYVSHVMDEIFSHCDRVTVLRDGAKVNTHRVSRITRSELVREMVGHELTEVTHDETRRILDRTVLSVEGLSLDGLVRGVSFSVHAGEILGIYGLLGSGRSELLHALFGAERTKSGTVTLNGRRVKLRTPEQAMKQGLALITANRHEEGLMLCLTLRKNTALPNLARTAVGGFVITDPGERGLVRSQIKEFHIVPADPEMQMEYFSGGNQQKALVAKWATTEPQVFLVDEPTIGVDVGAKEEIYNHLEQLAAGGSSLIVSSSYPPELLRLCDRILVMDSGEIVAEFERDQASQEKLLTAALGSGSAK